MEKELRMTREESIKQVSTEVLGSVEYQCGFYDGARWADETMIEKVCELYRREILHFNSMLLKLNSDGLIDIEKSYKRFKKAIKGIEA